uniref:RNA binding motif protein 33 n=1 Tax=Latimeria chalumnae TaxID=7897 RepID=H3AM38_LATCH
MAFGQPGPGFNQGLQPMFPRERPMRPNLQPQGPMGIPHFNQPGPASPRPFIPPRQQFPQGPVQPFPSPHMQPNMQLKGPMHPPPQQQQQHHHHHHHHHHQQQLHHHQLHHQQHHQHPPLLPPPVSGPQPLMATSQPQFRPLLQNPQLQMNNQIQVPQRQGPVKPRLGMPTQMINKRPNLPVQASASRNSNLRELPVAPPNAIKNNKSTLPPAAQVRPITKAVPAARAALTTRAAPAAKAAPTAKSRLEVKAEPENLDEDEETRLYRLKIEEQKRLREEILRQKELRRQQQAGLRKKELLERLAQQQSSQLPPAQQQDPMPQTPTNGNPQTPQPAAWAQQNKLTPKNQRTVGTRVQQHLMATPQIEVNPVLQTQPRKNVKQTLSQQGQRVAQPKPAAVAVGPVLQQTGKVASVQSKPQELRPGVKRTVMQRANSGSGDGPHVNAKVRVIKLSGGQGGENISFAHPEGQIQRPQQPQQQKQQPVRKVTLTKGTVLQKQQAQAQLQSGGPQGMKNNLRNHQQQQNKVFMQGRGKALAGQMGRERLMPNKQNLRVVECKPQPCVVSIEGLSSSTSDVQLKNLLMSVGPIQKLDMLPQQRKAIAKFKEPAHAQAFQQKFHRHMIDLSHINVVLIAE